MTIEELKVELSLLNVRRERLEGEILALFNKGCLPLEEAKEKMKTLGVKTEVREGVERVVFTAPDGKKGYTGFPLWYPLHTTMDDVFAGLETEKASIECMKKVIRDRQKHEQAGGVEPIDDNGYIADREKSFEKIDEYLANKAKIEDLSRVISIWGEQAEERTGEREETGGPTLTTEIEKHYFTVFCKENFPETYTAIRAAAMNGLVKTTNGRLDFLLSVGELCHLFCSTGCTEHTKLFINITSYIL
jgi:hypothetical protein